jgi:arginyl-tRNA synthetase
VLFRSSLQGNSGPYLQYSHARARSILAKAAKAEVSQLHDYAFNKWESTLVRKLTEYPEVVNQAVEEMMPHHICGYLYELAQTFNRFYENTRVIGAEQETDRLTLVSAYAGILASGLNLLGITAPDSM